jgi:alpha-mannosidase
MGYAWITPDTQQKTNTVMQESIFDGHKLRNEFCEVSVNPATGGIQSIHVFGTRGNRVSQQLALRSPGRLASVGSARRNPDRSVDYSIMAADSVEVTSSDGVTGTITSRGRILNAEGVCLAKFVQQSSLAFGSRLVELEFELETDHEPTADPWNNYYSARFAFPEAELEWYRPAGTARVKTSQARIESPVYVEVVGRRWSTAILTGGLPFHRRVLGRTLDTILVVRGERRRHFKMAIALNEANARLAAIDWLTPRGAWRSEYASAEIAPQSGWFFHMSSRSIVATSWELLSGNAGFIARFMETAGAAGRVCLQSWRPVRSARQTDFLGNTLCELVVEHDKIWMEINAYQWIQVEARFDG